MPIRISLSAGLGIAVMLTAWSLTKTTPFTGGRFLASAAPTVAPAKDVARAKRALIFGADTASGDMTGTGELGNRIGDNVAYGYIYPWLKTRYAEIYYLSDSEEAYAEEWKTYSEKMRNQADEAIDHYQKTGDTRDLTAYQEFYYASTAKGLFFQKKYVRKAWEDALSKYEVIDYVTALHSGGQFDYIPQGLKFKPGQLRLVYTTACNSFDASEFVTDPAYNAAVAVGHTGISASPFFIYKFLRRWVVGESVTQAIWDAFDLSEQDLKVFGGLLSLGGLWKDARDVIDSTEPRIAYTSEIDPHHFFVYNTTAPARDTPEKKALISRSARYLAKEQRQRCLSYRQWRTDANSWCEKDYWEGCDRQKNWSSCQPLK